MTYALILAGGSGTRFWPLSRESKPKQFLSIGEDKPLLRATVERVLPVCGWENLLVVTTQKHKRLINQILPELAQENLLIEPSSRNTAPAIGLAVLELNQRKPDGALIVLPADHIIRPEEQFRKIIRSAVLQAKQGGIVTLGVVPTRPETGFGYIHAERKLRPQGGCDVMEVIGFTEKPDLPTVMEYIQSGAYFWNSGMFVFTVETMMNEFANHMPVFHRGLIRAKEVSGKERREVLAQLFQEIESISIDYAIMEKTKNIQVIPCDFFWNDVGGWAALLDVLPKDESGNIVRGDVVTLDSQNCVIHADKRLVTCVGLQNMVVVETKDALLVCPIKEAQQVRRMVEELKRRKRTDVL